MIDFDRSLIGREFEAESPVDVTAEMIANFCHAIGAPALAEVAGLSQERLSADCGFDRTYISRVERGIINPTVSRLWRIADILGSPLSDMAKRMELWIVSQERPAKKLSRDSRRQ